MAHLPRCQKLFVVGCPRSGTSWVTSLIASHSDVGVVPGETHLYPLLYEPFVELPTWNWQQRSRSWKGILRRYGPLPLIRGFQPSDIWQGILRNYQILHRPTSHGLHWLANEADFTALMKSVRSQPVPPLEQAENLIAALLDHFFLQQGKLSKTLLEKTPMHIRYVDQILQRFPEARVIEVVRDGRDVCVSYNALAKHHGWARIGTEGAIRRWKQCVCLGERFRSRPELAPRIHQVRYEA